MSSATVTFACMKSWMPPGRRHGVERFPVNGAVKRALEQRQLPEDVAVAAPFVDDAAQLRLVDAAGEVDLLLREDLRERAEDRRGRDHRRGDADAASGLQRSPARSGPTAPRRCPA